MASELSRYIEEELEKKGLNPDGERENQRLIRGTFDVEGGIDRLQDRMHEQQNKKKATNLKKNVCITGAIIVAVILLLILIVKSGPVQTRTDSPTYKKTSEGDENTDKPIPGNEKTSSKSLPDDKKDVQQKNQQAVKLQAPSEVGGNDTSSEPQPEAPLSTTEGKGMNETAPEVSDAAPAPPQPETLPPTTEGKSGNGTVNETSNDVSMQPGGEEESKKEEVVDSAPKGDGDKKGKKGKGKSSQENLGKNAPSEGPAAQQASPAPSPEPAPAPMAEPSGNITEQPGDSSGANPGRL